MVSTRLWFCIPFFVGGIFEVIGYITQAISYNNTGALGPFLVQAIFLVLFPVFFAATLYMVYSRIVRAVHAESLSLLGLRRTTIIFVTGDLLCLNIQSTGSSLLGRSKMVTLGNYIIVAGLGLQALMFAVFVLCCLVFNIRLRARVATTGATSDVPWQSSLNMLYAASLAILVRNVYRVVEYIMGKHGYLTVREWPAYVFDAALMLLVMIGFFVWYPSQLRPDTRDSMIELLSDSSTSMEHSPGDRVTKDSGHNETKGRHSSTRKGGMLKYLPVVALWKSAT